MKRYIKLAWDIIRNPYLIGFVIFLLVHWGLFSLFGPITCNDGWSSGSIGAQGACSHHEGVDTSKGILIFLFSAFIAFIAWNFISTIQNPYQKPTPRALSPVINPCPICGASTRQRTAQKGKFKGQKFLGCSKYPACKGIINL
jgi:UDP-N-acetylmuramyl pentapeptide phosphotransferase/UDP-N-acetylglucosamine-1-phosphate transferase